MFRPRSLVVAALLAASSLLTLYLMGLSQWIQAILVIAVELSLGLIFHAMVTGPETRENASTHRRRPGHRAPLPSHKRKPSNVKSSQEPASPDSYVPVCRLMLTIRDYHPGLIEYALRECRSHQADLSLVFIRVCTVFPMGPSTEPIESDDDEANKVIGCARRAAERFGVPFHAEYLVSRDAPATILECATAGQADLLVMQAPRRGGFASKKTARDDVRAVLDALPEHIGLLVHA